MKLALCNEVLRELSFEDQCRYAAGLGYHALEIAPFTLSESPHQIPQSRRQELRSIVEDAGLLICGLHWLLVTPEGLSITTSDPGVQRKTRDVMLGLIDLCADLGGQILVHGSPQQRMAEEGTAPEETWKRMRDLFAEIAPRAAERQVYYCIEALTPAETNTITSMEEAIQLVGDVDHPAFQTMIDAKATATNESIPVAQVVERWLPTGMVRHIHFNDRNRRSPGQGKDRFTGILKVLRQRDYSGYVSMEPFDYHPDGRGSATFALAYVRGILDALEETSGS